MRNTERRATIAANLTEIRRERITNFFERMVKRLEAAITRLERLITRIESRIAKIGETNGDIDTAPITEDINEAKALLEEAKTDLQAAEDGFIAFLEATEPKEAFKLVREDISSVKQKLIEVHRILVHVIGDLKGLRVGQSSPVPSAAASPVVSPSPTVSPIPSP